MKKLVVLGTGALAAGAAALFGAGAAVSAPDYSSLNVVGEPYSQAVQILKSQGVKATFGGAYGNAVPLSQCLVDQQKIAAGKMILMMDCTKESQKDLVPTGGPTVGSNGVTTVTATPVVPIQGAPGAGAPPPA